MESCEIVVFCGGKCGSETLKNTFFKNGFKCLKAHSNCEFMKTHKTNETIFEIIDKKSKNNKIYIIDSYRTPIERKISSFFENINKHCPNYTKMSIEQLINYFNEKLIYNLEEYHSINEVMNYYNIINFDKFDFKTRYNLIENDNKVFIKILFKDISEWKMILSTILNKNIVLNNSNVSKNKNYYNIYQNFLKLYKVPISYLNNNLINDTQFKIYNTPEEQQLYFNNWKEKSI